MNMQTIKKERHMTQRMRAFFTLDEYLSAEEMSLEKHEYHKGEIYMMAGGNYNHSAIAGKIIAELDRALDRASKSCDVLTSDIKIYVPAEDFLTYADAAIVCGEPQFYQGNKNVIENPVLIVKVLSPSTRKYDLTDKFNFYSRLPSLQHYLLVEQNMVAIEHRWLDADGNWQSRDYTNRTDIVRLPDMGIELNVAEFYRRIRF
jgi:Uma2 family endonuclease